VAGSALLAPTHASAAELLSATWTQTLQGVALTVTNGGATCSDGLTTHVQQTITCPTAGLGATGSSTRTSFSLSLTMPSFSLTQFTTGGVIDLFTRAALAGGAVSITGNQSMAAATRGDAGEVTVHIATHVGKGANASMRTVGYTTLVKVPLSIGRAGAHTGWFYALTQLHYLTVDFYGWTPHTRAFTGLTTMGSALPDVVAMGSFRIATLRASKIPRSQLATGLIDGGYVTLVAPAKISVDGPFWQRRTVSLTTLELTFHPAIGLVHGAPEPGTLLLLAAGAAGLLLARRGAA
jgi:hypothetical protein